MPTTKDNSQAAESATFEEVGADVEARPERKPVKIKVKAGDQVSISGTVVSVGDDEVTIEINDGIEGNVHRVTLNSNQAEAALK